MPLFKSKPKLSIEECCKQFYDRNIFHAIIAGTDFWSNVLDIAFKKFVELDQSFASIDRTLFRNEMTALRMELFALAWSQRFKQDKYTFPQSLFTWRYLKENGNLHLGDVMGEYNRVVSQSVITDAKGAKFSGRTGNAAIVATNFFKTELAKEWAKNNLGTTSDRVLTEEEDNKAKCAGRVINRVGADIKRADGIVVKLLAASLAERLGCDLSLKSEAFFGLASIIFGFYKGAEEYLKSVDLLG